MLIVTKRLLAGLETNVRYDVRVLASTAKGTPSLHDEYWPWVSQITDENMNEGCKWIFSNMC